MERKEIDYTNLNKRIVEQAYLAAHTLNEEQSRKLIQDKLARAEAMRNAMKASPMWRSDR